MIVFAFADLAFNPLLTAPHRLRSPSVCFLFFLFVWPINGWMVVWVDPLTLPWCPASPSFSWIRPNQHFRLFQCNLFLSSLHTHTHAMNLSFLRQMNSTQKSISSSRFIYSLLIRLPIVYLFIRPCPQINFRCRSHLFRSLYFFSFLLFLIFFSFFFLSFSLFADWVFLIFILSRPQISFWWLLITSNFISYPF